jgi:hypothetical protein
MWCACLEIYEQLLVISIIASLYFKKSPKSRHMEDRNGISCTWGSLLEYPLS